MLYTLHFICNLANWYGLWRESSTLMLPKLVVKLFTVLFCTAFTLFILFCLSQGSSWMIHHLMHYANLDYYAASSIISFGGTILVGAATVFTIIQLWFLYILYEGYSMVREKEMQKIVDRRVGKLPRALGVPSNGVCSRGKPKVESNGLPLIPEEMQYSMIWPEVGYRWSSSCARFCAIYMCHIWFFRSIERANNVGRNRHGSDHPWPPRPYGQHELLRTETDPLPHAGIHRTTRHPHRTQRSTPTFFIIQNN